MCCGVPGGGWAHAREIFERSTVKLAGTVRDAWDRCRRGAGRDCHGIWPIASKFSGFIHDAALREGWRAFGRCMIRVLDVIAKRVELRAHGRLRRSLRRGARGENPESNAIVLSGTMENKMGTHGSPCPTGSGRHRFGDPPVDRVVQTLVDFAGRRSEAVWKYDWYVVPTWWTLAAA